jgi:hypothetical protein
MLRFRLVLDLLRFRIVLDVLRFGFVRDVLRAHVVPDASGQLATFGHRRRRARLQPGPVSMSAVDTASHGVGRRSGRMAPPGARAPPSASQGARAP